MVRENFFISVGRLSPMLPPFRGRTRVFLALFNALGLRSKHPRVDTWLTRPTRYRVNLDLHAWLERIAFLTGGYEDDLVRFLLQLTRASGRPGYLLDIGANIGLISVPYTLMRQAEGAAGAAPLAVCFEAIASNFAALQRHVQLNGLQEKMLVFRQALGDVAATVDIQVEGDLHEGEGTGTANILPAGSDYQCVRQTLEIRTLDSLADSGALPPGCAIVKIDTDGYDLKILLGARRFLERERPIIFGEFSAHCMNWHGQSIADVRSFAAAIGYSVYRRRGRDWQFAPDLPRPHDIDLLLVPDEKKAALAWCLPA